MRGPGAGDERAAQRPGARARAGAARRRGSWRERPAERREDVAEVRACTERDDGGRVRAVEVDGVLGEGDGMRLSIAGGSTEHAPEGVLVAQGDDGGGDALRRRPARHELERAWKLPDAEILTFSTVAGESATRLITVCTSTKGGRDASVTARRRPRGRARALGAEERRAGGEAGSGGGARTPPPRGRRRARRAARRAATAGAG